MYCILQVEAFRFPPGKGLLPRSARGNYGDYGDEFGGSLPVLLCIADLPAGGTRILLLLEGIHQRYVYHRAELGNLYLCRICDELLPDQGFALYHSGSGILRQEKNEQWLKAYLFLLSCEGVLLFPVVMLLSYFDLSLQVAVIYTIIVLVLVKILSFYKSYLIFFKRNGLFLQIILYFCALEVVPLSALWGGLVLISHY